MKRPLVGMIAAGLMLVALAAHAGELDAGKQMMAAGDLAGAAEFFNRYAASHPNDAANTPEALALAGRILDVMADSLTGQAEKGCYWNKGGGSPECMQRFAAQFNARFGAGAFRYEHAITYILYTGSHYRQLASAFPKSAYAPEADFYLLLRELVGHPDIVVPKVKAFLAKYPKGEWNRRGLLLWARVNEDVWYVHHKWSWVLYNYQISPEDLIIKAEPYRQEALKAYEKLMKEPGTFEGRAAAREYALLKDNKDDGVLSSIVNDSSPGTLAAWGIAQPAAPVELPDRGAGSGNAPGKSAPEPATAPAKAAPAAPPSAAGKEIPMPIPTPVVPLPPTPTPEKGKASPPPTRW